MKHRYSHNYRGLCGWKTLLEVDTVTFIVVEAALEGYTQTGMAGIGFLRFFSFLM